jgi:hypothetical protein
MDRKVQNYRPEPTKKDSARDCKPGKVHCNCVEMSGLKQSHVIFHQVLPNSSQKKFLRQCHRDDLPKKNQAPVIDQNKLSVEIS